MSPYTRLQFRVRIIFFFFKFVLANCIPYKKDGELPLLLVLVFSKLESQFKNKDRKLFRASKRYISGIRDFDYLSFHWRFPGAASRSRTAIKSYQSVPTLRYVSARNVSPSTHTQTYIQIHARKYYVYVCPAGAAVLGLMYGVP